MQVWLTDWVLCMYTRFVNGQVDYNDKTKGIGEKKITQVGKYISRWFIILLFLLALDSFV